MEVIKWVVAVFVAAVIGYLGKITTQRCMEKAGWKKSESLEKKGEKHQNVRDAKPDKKKLKSQEKLEKKRLKLEKKRLKKLEKERED